MNRSNAAQQSLPQPQIIQHSRPGGLSHQIHSHPSHQLHNLQPSTQSPYISPAPSTQTLPSHRHQQNQQQTHHNNVSYVPSGSGLAQQAQHSRHNHNDNTIFGTHPSPYSTNSASESYTSDLNDNMAAQAAMARPPFAQSSSYQTPQSNSPASINSPQTDATGRPMYSMTPVAPQIYYQAPYSIGQTGVGQHAPVSHSQSMSSTPSMLSSYHPQQHHLLQNQSHHMNPHQQQGHVGLVESQQPQALPQRTPSVAATTQGTPQPTGNTPSAAMAPPSAGQASSAAPGPIPATTPLVVRQDGNGVQWIAFEYSRDRVKMEYQIRCDVESVNVEELPQDFKSANCVYPRACCNKEQYKGNRLHYESECNAVGWALAELNPALREKRGLIQRAVDSWRNSNQDPRLRSRRVRRMAKINTRKAGSNPPGAAGQLPNSQSPYSGLHNQQATTDYETPPAHHHQPPLSNNSQHAAAAHQNAVSSPTPLTPSSRYAQNFYPQYPSHASSSLGARSVNMPPVHDGLDHHYRQNTTLASPATTNASRAPGSGDRASTVKREREEDDDREHDRALFGDVPEAKRRKFILVEDAQRGTRIRVRAMLEQVKMNDMPDSYLKANAVFPRSYFPRQGVSPSSSPRAAAGWDDEDDEEDAAASGTMPTHGKTMVEVPLMEGGETTRLPVPRMTKSQRNKEVTLNELGYRMSWGQARTFNGRTLFLQKSLDAYRNKMRSTLTMAGGDEPLVVAPHFETRPGKRKWLERDKRSE